MDHRYLPSSFRRDQSYNRNQLTAEQSYIHLGRAVAPENGSRGVIHSASQWNSESRGNERHPSSFSMELPHFQPALSAPSYDPFPQSSAAGNLYLAPQNNAGHAYSDYYGRCNIRENQSATIDSVTGNGRGPFKRKSPEISVAFERGSTSRFCSVGSSSSSELPQGKQNSAYQNIPSGNIGLPHYGGGSLSIPGEDPLRNVRNRSRLDMGANIMRTDSSTYSARHYHSTTHSSNYHGVVNVSSTNADETTRFMNFGALPPTAHGRIQTSGINSLSHESNHFLVRRSGTEIRGCHLDSTSSRNLVSPSQYVHAPPLRSEREGRHTHSQRPVPPYRPGPSCPWFRYQSASTEHSLQSLSAARSSDYSRPSMGGWSYGHRSGRSRIAFEQIQSISSIVDAQDRIGSEELRMMDNSSLYTSSRNLFDQYTDMRLDVDNMSYEELLALGEQIGSVSTGLSEDMIPKCLIETKSSDKHHEGTCCICLEEYGSDEEVGTLKKCGHDYHASCIKKWVLMKNVCPVCKAPALALDS
ncbi:probable E3 ubiquitin-protein ligase RHG1A [Diospyros lotus]|uniref:probable E3 ubiquitin-protein ligase RHG1A n=1 Tax=Diospyros lotus TaxID=55363 RepID=UPI002250133C|nr:probable E3 ubiquitin-protein ligase RHG1A [Diospyros lotus]XP_052199640.1 probable E3 ubiquitin-protein ligase RHG1A [Diospyros lotus]XP_052199641.1 probable E3 ubiquitin-protein ligase RHG1A [Diospyros lotus]XP_052199642.1 probable E3 ubiquitin-protein ligase RHG1A [Diospyros lotus]XP_052199644.1 probable E3 ubiquitin-protein ligase RHG1A [Diospyros lotus]XP_052199645.1 probable E3 ubiquitin-protein ligase RHG1A [Diospyros lotus]XP_052199646.1 probable E3 ubiquitin-protein ligase RHG1A [